MTAVNSAQDKEVLKRLTLLYVEDDEDARVQFTLFLTRLFGKLVVAGHGAEGLAQYREHRPDIIVTDIQMPVMDGLAMARQIRAEGSRLPIIVLSAFDQPSYLIESGEIGIDRYVTKPVDCRQLVSSLLECAGRLTAE